MAGFFQSFASASSSPESEPLVGQESPRCGIPRLCFGVAAFVILAVFIFVVRYPAWHFFSCAFFGGSHEDSAIYVWAVKEIWLKFRAFDFSAESSAFYPFGKTLAYTDSFALPSIGISLLVEGLYFKFPTAYNAIIVCSWLSCGLFTYLLAGEFIRSFWPKIFAGAAFCLSPFFFSQLGHPQLQFAWVIPASMLFSMGLGKKSPFMQGAALGCVLVCAFLSSVYYFYFSFLLSALVIACDLIRKPEAARYAKAAFGLFLSSWPLVIFGLAYQDVREVFGVSSLAELKGLSATILSYVSAHPSDPTLGSITTSLSKHAEGYLFPGFSVLLLSLASLSFGMPNQKTAAWASRSVLFIVCVLLPLAQLLPSLDLAYTFAAETLTLLACWTMVLVSFSGAILFSKSQMQYRKFLLIFVLSFFLFLSLGVIGPIEDGAPRYELLTILNTVIPGMNSIRATARFGVVVLLALSLLAGISLEQIMLRSKKFSLPIALIALLVLSFELSPKSFPAEPLDEVPGAYRSMPLKPGAIISLPVPDITLTGGNVFARRHTQAMLWAQAANRKTVNGYSGKIPRFIFDLPKKLSGFPDERSLDYMGRIVGLKYVVYHPQWNPNFSEADFVSSITRLCEHVSLIRRFEDGTYLLELHTSLPISNFELYLPPSKTKPRRLTFQADSDCADTTHSLLNLSLGHNRTESGTSPVEQQIPITTCNEWQDAYADMPASINAVVPHNVTIQSAGKNAVRVRNIEVSQ